MGSPVINNCSLCNNSQISKKLDLHSKLNLVKYLNKNANKPTSVEIAGLKKIESGLYHNKPYLLSAINLKNIKELEVGVDNSTAQVNEIKDFQTLLDMIAVYENQVISQPNSELAWDALYKLYLKLGEIDKANRAMDKLIQSKMNNV